MGMSVEEILENLDLFWYPSAIALNNGIAQVFNKYPKKIASGFTPMDVVLISIDERLVIPENGGWSVDISHWSG